MIEPTNPLTINSNIGSYNGMHSTSFRLGRMASDSLQAVFVDFRIHFESYLTIPLSVTIKWCQKCETICLLYTTGTTTNSVIIFMQNVRDKVCILNVLAICEYDVATLATTTFSALYTLARESFHRLSFRVLRLLWDEWSSLPHYLKLRLYWTHLKSMLGAVVCKGFCGRERTSCVVS